MKHPTPNTDVEELVLALMNKLSRLDDVLGYPDAVRAALNQAKAEGAREERERIMKKYNKKKLGWRVSVHQLDGSEHVWQLVEINQLETLQDKKQ